MQLKYYKNLYYNDLSVNVFIKKRYIIVILLKFFNLKNKVILNLIQFPV